MDQIIYPKRLSNDKHSSLLVAFVSYEENEVLWILSKIFVNLPEAKFLVVCEWLMNELGARFERDRYELFGVFLVTCKQARHEFWGHIFSHVRPFYEWAASDWDP
jgi:hypothetical protein